MSIYYQVRVSGFDVTRFTGFRMTSIFGDVFVGVPDMGICAGLVGAGTGNTPFLGRGNGIFARYSFVRERDFTFITGPRDNPVQIPHTIAGKIRRNALQNIKYEGSTLLTDNSSIPIYNRSFLLETRVCAGAPGWKAAHKTWLFVYRTTHPDSCCRNFYTVLRG